MLNRNIEIFAFLVTKLKIYSVIDDIHIGRKIKHEKGRVYQEKYGEKVREVTMEAGI